MKLGNILLLVLAATFLILCGGINPREAAASVEALNQWSATPNIVSNGTTSPVTAKFTPAPGASRLMLVAVATEYSAAQAPTFTVTYGGQTVTMLQNNTTGNSKLWLGYLNENGVNTGSTTGNKILSVTPSTTTSLTALYASVAVYGGVDQATPITGSGSLGITAAALTIGPVGYTLTGNAGLAGNNGMSVYVTNWNNAVGQTTASTGYTAVRNYLGTNFSLAFAQKATVGTGAESVTSTTTTTSALAALAGVGLNPAVRIAASSSCSDCHGYPPQDSATRGVPAGQFPGTHEKHSGTDEAEYAYACTVCHYNAAAYNHSTGYKNLTGSKLPGNAYVPGKKLATTNNPTLGNCNNTLCHSTGRGPGVVQFTPPTWGGSSTTCLTCHAGRTNGTGAQANSTAGFKLSSSHSQHLKYPAVDINCNLCHGKTTALVGGNLVLKQYSGIVKHVDGVATVTFNDLSYGSYSAYKTATKTCNNISCHGGKSRGSWQNTGAINLTHTCTNCHGQPQVANIATSNTDLKMYAPGWVNGSNTGTSTDQNTASSDPRVGAHYVHLSSVYMKKLKCNECHTVPSTPFSGTHMTGPRYNSQSVTFSQASTAIKNGLTGFTQYTSGTATKAATCSTTYCHGNKMIKGDTAGSYRKPSWNQDLTSNTPSNVVCGRCHGIPPNSVSGSHTAGLQYNQCSGCHSQVVNSSGVIINKDLHINGKVEASSHAYSYPGLTHKTAAGSSPFSACTGCHTNAKSTNYPYTSTLHDSKLAPDCQGCHTKSTPLGTAAGCSSCHGADGVGMPNGANTAFPNYSGSHSAHSVQGYACADCHNGRGSGNRTHGNYSGIIKTSYTNISVAFNTAKSGTAAKWNKGANLAASSCTTSVCHGQTSPAWGAPVPTQQCRRCHGSQSVAYTGYTQNTVAPGGSNIDTGRSTGTTARGGMHQEHITGSLGMSRRVRCSECHTVPAVVNHAQLDNRTTATVAFTGVPTLLNHSPSVARVNGIINCSNTECHHGGNRPEGTLAGQSGFSSRAALTWTNTGLLTGADVTGTCIAKCHQLPPGAGLAGDSHSGLTATPYDTPTKLQACNTCHKSISATASTMANLFADKSVHINGVVDGGSCLGCHSSVVNGRAAASAQFGYQSHHIQGVEQLTNAQCYQCHWEANSDGTINATHHGGQANPGSSVGLVVWTGTSRPTTATPGTTYISYTANGKRSSIAKLNIVCLGCHNTPNQAIAPFGKYTTNKYAPEQYLLSAKPKTSIQSRYSSTRTVAWSQYKYSSATGGVKRYGTNNKAQITKALSAHGNAIKNQFPQFDRAVNGKGEDGWLTTGTGIDVAQVSARTNTNKNVMCFDCHNSHGSDVAGITSSYSSATGRYKGGLLKSTVAGQGGYTVTYKPAQTRAVTYKQYSAVNTLTPSLNAGANLCNDCHNDKDSSTAGVARGLNYDRPWTISGTYSSSKAIVGYWSTPYFDNYTMISAIRTAYKAGSTGTASKDLRKPMGGHYGTSVNNTSASHLKEINGLCTPCHDPHGVSNALGTDRDHGVPLLKGTWITSPYREDKAEPVVKRGGGSTWAGMPNMGSIPGYNIDQNTFLSTPAPLNGGAASATASSNKRQQRFRSFSLLSSAYSGTNYPGGGTMTPTTFAGICLECHNQAALTGSATRTTSAAWKDPKRVHQSVAGWSATNGTNANNVVHAYTCAKCHAPHVSRLPRLLVTNCLDVRHTQRSVAGGSIYAGSTPTTATYGNILNNTIVSSSAMGAGRFPGGGSRYSGTPASGQNPGGWWFQTNGAAGSTQPTRTTPNFTNATGSRFNYGSGCHNAPNAGGATYDPTKQIWNNKSRW